MQNKYTLIYSEQEDNYAKNNSIKKFYDTYAHKMVNYMYRVIINNDNIKKYWNTYMNSNKINKASISDKNKESLIKLGYLDYLTITNKHEFIYTFKNCPFVPYSIIHSKTKTDYIMGPPTQNGKFILKPSDETIGGQTGIKIVNDMKEIEFISIIKNGMESKISVTQEYIQPFLVNGVKPWYRIFSFIFYDRNNFYLFTSNPLICLSDVKYDVNNLSKDTLIKMHVIGSESSKCKMHMIKNSSVYKLDLNDDIDYKNINYFSNEHLVHKDLFNININEELNKILIKIFKRVFCDISYQCLINNNTECGFINLGIDFLIDSKQKIYILEVNKFAGTNTSYKYFNSIWNELFEKQFINKFIDSQTNNCEKIEDKYLMDYKYIFPLMYFNKTTNCGFVYDDK